MHFNLPYYPLIAHWCLDLSLSAFFVYPFFIKQGADFNPSAGMAVYCDFSFLQHYLSVIGQIIDAFP